MDASSSRYIFNKNGTISDKLTGLMWQESYSYPENGVYLNWFNSWDYVAELNKSKLGGHEDWRLPTRLEIQSIYEIERTFESRGRIYKLHIDPLFEFSYGSCYWTIHTRLSAALGFEFDLGELCWYPQAGECGSVRAVRQSMKSKVLI
jgi:hypothetical protein